MLEVIDPGLQTTVQDLGRPGWGHLGVPEGGAADPWSARIANLLAGNDEGAALLEIVLAGPRLRALEPLTIALTGADLGASIPRGTAVRLAPGEELRVPGPAARGAGARAYLAVAGGIDVPVVLGSRSTCAAGAFGGFEGRGVRTGDRLPIGATSPERRPSAAAWPGDPLPPRRVGRTGATTLRTLPGLANLGPNPETAPLPGTTFRVSDAWDRMGLRLDPPIAAPAGHVTSHGVVRGAIQLPPDGRPIVLLADHQPTGGYAIIAVVIAADLPILGQLAPGDEVVFEPVDLPAARAALADAEAAFASARATHATEAAAAADDDPWDDLWRTAGA